MSEVVGLFYDMWNSAAAGLPAHGRGPRQLYRRAVWIKSNPRSAADMKRLLNETWPGARFVDIRSEPAWLNGAKDCETLVLLYPDAIGLGIGAIERKVLRARRGRGAVQVLTGRRRQFALTRPVRRALLMRRLLERTMLGELLFGLVFVVATPLLLTLDLVRGRR